jgi:hypothetical protein
MHRVVVGVHAAGISEANRERCEAAAAHFRWDGGRLHVRGQDGGERLVVPWGERRGLVRKLAEQLGFPGGKRLYALAKERYYWTSM